MLTEPFCRTDLRELGLTRRALASLLASGDVVRPFRGVYLPSKLADDPVARARALALLLPQGAAVTRTAAAWLHGLDVRPPGTDNDPAPLECVVPAHATPPRHDGIRAYSARLPGSDVTEIHGVPVTSVERTALDLARYLSPNMGLAALDALAHEQRLDPVLLGERIEEWRGERGVAKARRLIGLCEPLTESFGESWLRLRIVDAGFPIPQAQIWIKDGDTGVYRLDLGWESRRIGIEYDGMEFHSSASDRRRDERRRDRLAREFGWHVVGVGRGEVLGPSLTLELGIGELLGMRPAISRRPW